MKMKKVYSRGQREKTLICKLTDTDLFLDRKNNTK